MKKQFTYLAFSISAIFFVSCGQLPKDHLMSTKADRDSIQNPRAEIGRKPASVTPENGTTLDSTTDLLPMEGFLPSKQIMISKRTEGSLVYYCPGRMLENTDNNVSVTITNAVLLDAMEHLGKKVEATIGKSLEVIKKDINGSPITISARMKVELKFNDKDFQTIYKPENEDQLFDGINDMNWDWIIKPQKVGSIQLSIVVSAFDEKNNRWLAAQSPPKIFNIKVQVDPRSYFSKLWAFLEANPEWVFIQIFFPIIAFFFGKRQGKMTSK